MKEGKKARSGNSVCDSTAGFVQKKAKVFLPDRKTELIKFLICSENWSGQVSS
jgi:hypothetical protein